MLSRWKIAIVLLPFFVIKGNAKECVPRSFGADRIVCVCNATYCDSTPDNDPKIPENGSFYWYVSTKEGFRLNLSKGQADSCEDQQSDITLQIDTTKTYQTIFGFGGAFTDSVGINIKKLSPAAQDQLIRTYYDPKEGSRYLLGRIPIGGSDFSTRGYTYDDHPDDSLLYKFSLAEEDYIYKIPFLRKAIQLNPDVKFVSAAWSPPKWMKTNGKYNGFGFLKKEYYQTYSNYLLKFLDEYAKNGIDIWGISTGNEPINAYVPLDLDPLSTLGWTPHTMANWVANNLGPSLANSDHNDTVILALDDQRILLPWYMQLVFKNEKARNYIAGTAVHWYFDSIAPSLLLDKTHDAYPDKFILMTEACTGSGILDFPKVSLGSWDRGEQYILSIIDYMNHWAVGWVDWNLVLDETGGPNWINNFVDSPIIVSPETDEFFKQPMYYALKHFSRFVDRGSIRISISETNKIKTAAFITPLQEVVVVLYNKNTQATNVTLNDSNKGPICVKLPARSMNTIIYAR